MKRSQALALVSSVAEQLEETPSWEHLEIHFCPQTHTKIKNKKIFTPNGCKQMCQRKEKKKLFTNSNRSLEVEIGFFD